ncbi:MAG: hypothetical protein Q4E05_03535 [Pseudoclavibacter sp.]|nr:hypothetical protein [Pseudoclavibacter sp.]
MRERTETGGAERTEETAALRERAEGAGGRQGEGSPAAALRERLETGRDEALRLMYGFLQPEEEDGEELDPGYTEADVAACGRILDAYIARVCGIAASSLPDPRRREQALAAVERAVRELNGLNERCGEGMIETEERERLAEAINDGAVAAGLPGGEDYTEAWREW